MAHGLAAAISCAFHSGLSHRSRQFQLTKELTGMAQQMGYPFLFPFQCPLMAMPDGSVGKYKLAVRASVEFTQSWHVLECNESLHRQSVDGYIEAHQQMYEHDGRGSPLQRHVDEHMEYPSQ